MPFFHPHRTGGMIPKILPRYWLISFVLYIGTNFGLMICGGRLRDVFQKGYNKFNDKFNTAYMALSALYFMSVVSVVMALLILMSVSRLDIGLRKLNSDDGDIQSSTHAFKNARNWRRTLIVFTGLGLALALGGIGALAIMGVFTRDFYYYHVMNPVLIMGPIAGAAGLAQFGVGVHLTLVAGGKIKENSTDLTIQGTKLDTVEA